MPNVRICGQEVTQDTWVEAIRRNLEEWKFIKQVTKDINAKKLFMKNLVYGCKQDRR